MRNCVTTYLIICTVKSMSTVVFEVPDCFECLDLDLLGIAFLLRHTRITRFRCSKMQLQPATTVQLHNQG